jgi:hypothetical protein
MNKETIDMQKSRFVSAELFSLTFMGVAQRGRLYSDGSGSTGESRESFRLSLRLILEDLAENYTSQIDDQTHIANIEKLSNDLSWAHRAILNGGRLRIGSAQKALNLYLKYLWCMGQVMTPPHCPFDSVIIGRLPGCETVKWTQLDCIETYKNLVSSARTKAKKIGLFIAEWQLKAYSDVRSNGVGMSDPAKLPRLSRLRER